MWSGIDVSFPIPSFPLHVNNHMNMQQDLIVSTILIGGAILLLTFALFSYMGIFHIFGFAQSHSSFYSGKHVLITGGSSGIGKELARLLLSYGASVTLAARNEDRLNAAAAELAPPEDSSAATRRVNTVSVDCSDAKAVERMCEHVEHDFGVVDIIVNSAGGSVGGYFEEMSPDTFMSQMQSNYFSKVYPAQAFFKRMCKRRSGHIVFISSMAGQTGVFGYSAYSPSKYAVRGLAETVYFEGRPFGINVSIVFPPDTDTPCLHHERQTLPKETMEIANAGGLFDPKHVARAIANGIRRKKFRITVGVIGYMLGVLTAGLTPGVSVADILLVPVMRAITPFYLWDQNAIIRRHHKDRTTTTSETPQTTSASSASS